MCSSRPCPWIGKVAVVTGVSEGSIGSGIAQKLVEEGLLVVGISRKGSFTSEYAKKVSGKKGVFYARGADVTNEQSVIDVFKWISGNIGPVSILVNAAGIVRKSSLIGGDVKDWKDIFDTHVLGLSVVTKEAIKIMRENTIDGQIIHINSIFGHKVPNLSTVHVHPASKFAVTALTETLRQELNSINSKIKITSLSPGVVKTPLIEGTDWSNQPGLNIEDIADSVLYILCTPPHVQIHELTIKPVGEDL